MLALSDTAGVILLVLGGIFVVAASAALILRSRVTHEPAPDIPPAMEPGPSDPALETPLLQKLQGWGVLLVAFFVVWLPYTWLIEPSTNLEQEKALKTEAIAEVTSRRCCSARRTSSGWDASGATVRSSAAA